MVVPINAPKGANARALPILPLIGNAVALALLWAGLLGFSLIIGG